MDLSVKY